MVIDEMIYDPSNNGDSSSSFSVVKGVFSFVSGQVAKAGDDAMVVKTPVASIGIRGTTVAGKAAAEGSSNSITLLPDADGGVGQIAVSNSAGTQIMSVPFQTTSLTSAFTAPAPPVIVQPISLRAFTAVISRQFFRLRQRNSSSNSNKIPARVLPLRRLMVPLVKESRSKKKAMDRRRRTLKVRGSQGRREKANRKKESGEEGEADAERPPGEAGPGDAPPGETA